MPTYYLLLSVLLAFFHFDAYAQKKILIAKSTAEIIKIDGIIDEESWKSAPIATDFVMYEPDNGKPISKNKNSEVKVLYDNSAIYIAAVLNDESPDKIVKEVTNRDVFGNADHFSVSINGFNDGQQDYKFFVSAAGVQMDCLSTENLDDYNWDAIWESKVSITDKGWVVEMKIPYAAFRFSKLENQQWGINFTREIKRDFQTYTWNYVDTKIKSTLTQEGLLAGIKSVKTPTRLFLIPYTSAYYQQNDLGSDRIFKAGIDIKYGINDSFTLDAVLVPDFGQTKFDNAILNLAPFEQKLDENRAFFTEATDLFNKGNLFYSRRIGGEPTLVPDRSPNEKITNYPVSSDLLNAIKISGRTSKGLGIGFLNAVTDNTFATILNDSTKFYRNVLIAPRTNYNILVFDQRFNKNSSLSFINTNTMRNGSGRDANVAALLFDLNSKQNSYAITGNFKESSVFDSEDTNGISTELSFAKTRGQYRYRIASKYVSKNFDINDLGINFYTNYHLIYLESSYRIVHPTGQLNSFKATQNINVEIENSTGKLQEAWYEINAKATTIKNNYFESILRFNPIDRFDFYEPLSRGKYVFVPKSAFLYLYFISDKNKKFSLAIDGSIEKFNEKNRITYQISPGMTYRFSDKFSLYYNLGYTKMVNNRGWAAENSSTIFGERNREIVQHDFTGKYSLTNKMNINLAARYYWSYSDVHKFYTLQDDGYLALDPTYALNKNRNFNSWNFDLSYSWWFAPGSELTVLYRNFAKESKRIVERSFTTNFSNVLNNNLNNIVSISLRYYIDYNTLKKQFKS